MGDLLFQIVFHSQLASELGQFSLADVADAIADKLISRHPHVFGDRAVSVTGPTQVLENWARLKAKERVKKTGKTGSALTGVPIDAPALLRAERLTEKAARVGFDWDQIGKVREKLNEELAELDQAIAGKNPREVEQELGDVLFTLANLGRWLKTPAEDALRGTNAKFTRRFQRVEALLEEQQVPFGTATLEQMDALWDQAKAEERNA